MSHGFAHWSVPLIPFAGPAATIIASITAATVTFIFGKRQTEIARGQKEIAASQRDIAHEKLKADLFDRRFAVYEALREGCLHCMRRARECDFSEVFRLTKSVEGAPFLFGDANARYLLDLREKLFQYAANCDVLRRLQSDDGSYQEFLQKTGKSLVSINDAFNQLPKQIKDEMGARDILTAHH